MGIASVLARAALLAESGTSGFIETAYKNQRVVLVKPELTAVRFLYGRSRKFDRRMDSF